MTSRKICGILYFETESFFFGGNETLYSLPDNAGSCLREDSMNRQKCKDFFADLFFPSQCAFCRKVMQTRYLQICDDCAKELPEPPRNRRGEFFTTCVSALPYADKTRTAILRMKMGGKSACTVTFGRLLAAQIAQKLDGRYDLITWVPVAGLRRLRRGFDQDQLIAEAAAEELDMPLMPLLKKRRLNRAQASISDASARRINVLNAFRPIHKEAIVGKRILLIDDVITTGATLSECSRVLLTAGAAQVVCATFAATNRKQ